MLKIPDVAHLVQHHTEKTAGGKLRTGKELDLYEAVRFPPPRYRNLIGGREHPRLVPIEVQPQRHPFQFPQQAELIEHIEDIVEFEIDQLALLPELSGMRSYSTDTAHSAAPRGLRIAMLRSSTPRGSRVQRTPVR